MKVLLISPLPPPAGGIATWTEKYVHFFANNGLSCDVVNTAVIGERVQEINRRKKYIEEIKRSLIICNNIKKRIKDYKPNISHINTSCTATGTIRDYCEMRIINRYKIPVVLHCRCNIEDQLQGKIANYLFAKMVKKAKIVLTLNSSSFAFVERIIKNKARILPNFVDVNQLLTERTISESINNIVFVGHVWKPKGVIEIVEAARRLPSIIFRLIGPIRDEIKRINLPNNVVLMGEQSTAVIKKELLDADVFLFPSYTEGFANALVEAMAAGLPIITTPVGANKDMIESHGGYIVPVNNVEAIVEAIQKMEPLEKRQEMSKWNLQKVEKSYLIDPVMRKLLDIYNEVLQ